MSVTVSTSARAGLWPGYETRKGLSLSRQPWVSMRMSNGGNLSFGVRAPLFGVLGKSSLVLATTYRDLIAELMGRTLAGHFETISILTTYCEPCRCSRRRASL